MAVPSKTIQVQAISPGIAMGRVMVLQRHSGSSVPVKKEILGSEIDGEMERFFNAVSLTKNQLLSLKEEMTAKLNSGDTAIIDVLITLTEDPSLTTEVKKRISKNLWNVEYAIYDIDFRVGEEKLGNFALSVFSVFVVFHCLRLLYIDFRIFYFFC